MVSKQTIAMEGRVLTLSNMNKILWPERGFTKADLISYYVAVSQVLIPHLKDRLLVMTRYPNGVEGKSFYQKNAPEHLPEWIRTFTYSGTRYILVEETATLVWLANQGAIGFIPGCPAHPPWTALTS